jgi:hypothetical protein
VPKKKPIAKTPPVPVPTGKRKRLFGRPGTALREADQQEADLAVMAGWMARGWQSPRIHQELNALRKYDPKLSERSIRNDMAKIRDKWHESQLVSMTSFVNREILLLDYMQGEALESWEKSKQEGTRTEAEQANFTDQGKRPGTRSKVTRIGRDGTPEFLIVALKCQERRAKLLGLDKPTKYQPTGEDGAPLLLGAGTTPHVLEITITNADGTVHAPSTK